MKAKKLNEELFGRMELNQANLDEVKGGDITEVVYSGSGINAVTGKCVDEYCCCMGGYSWMEYV